MTIIGKTNPNARRLRRNATDAERRLWHHLRNRNLGGFKFRWQVTIGPFVADFACVELKLVIEADGGQHGSARDAKRTADLERLGWRVLRFWNHDILQRTDDVLAAILETCNRLAQENPSPNPLPQAGEGY